MVCAHDIEEGETPPVLFYRGVGIFIFPLMIEKKRSILPRM